MGGRFFRKQTPGDFMMRVRMPNGITSATQFRTLGGNQRGVRQGVL